jgi:hypothetical protein
MYRLQFWQANNTYLQVGHHDKASNPEDVIHSDVVVPFPESQSGARSFVSFIDK